MSQLVWFTCLEWYDWPNSDNVWFTCIEWYDWSNSDNVWFTWLEWYHWSNSDNVWFTCLEWYDWSNTNWQHALLFHFQCTAHLCNSFIYVVFSLYQLNVVFSQIMTNEVNAGNKAFKRLHIKMKYYKINFLDIAIKVLKIELSTKGTYFKHRNNTPFNMPAHWVVWIFCFEMWKLFSSKIIT